MIIVFTLYNCIELPIEIAFAWRKQFDENQISDRLDNVIDFLFLCDIFMNFRTTFFHSVTGEEIVEKDKIRK